MMEINEFDYTVIGSGPGGYVSAIRAAQLGLKSAVIEKAEPGGICLNWGCIPTKALLHSAHLYRKVKNGHAEFIGTENLQPNLTAIVKRSREVAARLSKGIESLFKKYKVTLIKGTAFIEAPGKLRVDLSEGDKLELRSRYLCIATGARAREIGDLKFSKNVVSYREAMTPTSLPEKLLVIGAGAIGSEFADFYNALGSQVTLIEVADHILPTEEKEVAAIVAKAFKARGMVIHEKAKILNLIDTGSGVTATIEVAGDKQEEKFDRAILAIGVVGNIEGIGFENTGGVLEKGLIKIDEQCRVVGAKNIFAIGDVTGGKQLAHKASHEGIIAAEAAAGKKPHPLDMNNVAGCIYTEPQVASVGFKEAELKEKKIPYEIGTFPFLASGRALASGSDEGFCKVYLHKETGEILGAHLVGPEVTELISNIALGRTGELTFHEFADTVAPHPSLGEALFEAILAARGKSCNF